MPNHVHVILVPSDEDGLRRAETVGRPIGDPDWLAALEARTGRTLAPGRRGTKSRKEI